jgi:hypothetical protein
MLECSAAWMINGTDVEEGLQLTAEPCPDFGIDAVAYPGAFDGSLYEAGVLQFFEVL